MNLIFSQSAWEEYIEWQSEDRRTLNKINALLKSISRSDPLSGEGKPEHLRYANAYSRRIDGKNRLVYRYDHDQIVTLSCKGHYDDH